MPVPLGPPELSMEPSGSIVLNNTMVGTTGIAQSFDVFNYGGLVSDACEDVSLSGTNASEFVLSGASNCKTGIVPGVACSGISVSAKPTSTGAKSAALNLVCGSLTQSVNLSYTAQAMPVAASIVFYPSSFAFMSTAVGSSSVAKTMSVQNPGDSAIASCSTATLTGANASEFVLSGAASCNGGIASKGSCNGISVSAKPSTSGSKSATLNLVCGGLSKTASLSYTATAKVIKVIDTDWETGDLMQNIYYPYSLCNKPYDAQISTDYSRKGTHSVRFEVRATDATCGGSKRAELYVPGSLAVTPTLKWFAWSDYMPADYAKDAKAESHFQLHHSGATGSPIFGVWVQDDKYYFVQSYDHNEDGVITQVKHDLGAVRKGQWDDWVVYIDTQVDASGKLMVWRNGVKVLEVNGPNTYMINGKADPKPYPKFGIYKWPWSNGGTFNPSTRVIYMDAVSMGTSANSIGDFLMQ